MSNIEAYEILRSFDENDTNIYYGIQLAEGFYDEENPEKVWLVGHMFSDDETYDAKTQTIDVEEHEGLIFMRLMTGEVPIPHDVKEEQQKQYNLYVVKRVEL